MRIVTMPPGGSAVADAPEARQARQGIVPAAWQDAPLSRPLVVEVFGPAGAGKTTCAATLHAALRAAGRPSIFVSSARPAERAARGASGFLAPFARAAKLFGALAGLGAEDPVGRQLLALFPPRGAVARLRQRRYLARLHCACAAGRPARSTLILDQGYLSALCSLAARCGLARASAPPPLLARALELLPPPDLIVWVETPEAVVRERLLRRLAGQSRLERMFELDLPTLADQARLAEMLLGLLRARGQPLVEVRGLALPREMGGLREAVDALGVLAAARGDAGDDG